MDKLSNDISKLDISVTYQKDLVVINSQETEDKTSTINITNTTPETDESHDSGKTYESYNSARPPRRKARDPTWLQVEVCREYLRQECHRSAEECKFAHPKNHCAIENGRVITCYDSLKSRCSRERCKYYHPPKHIKKQIQQLGKSYQKMGYNQPNIENTETQYPCWVPWNVYYLTDVYPYPHAYPNYGYYNYFDVFPNCENYKLEYDQNYYSYEDPSNNNQNIKIENSTTSPSKEKCAIITDNTN